MEENYVLYTLSDPDTDELRYVGITGGLAGRVSSHMSHQPNYANQPLKKWLQDLRERNLRPKVQELSSYPTRQEACTAEIDYLKAADRSRLFNISDGGDGLNLNPEREAQRVENIRIAGRTDEMRKTRSENQTRRMADPRVKSKYIRVVIANDGRKWDSVGDCANDLGVSATAVSKAIRKGGNCTGLTLRFEDGLPTQTRIMPPHVCKKVRCVDTQEVFESMVAVAKVYNVDSKTVKKAIVDKLHLGGHWFEFVT